MAHKPSSIDRLPEEVRAKIAELRRQNITIDQILEHLGTLGVEVSRSALGRHVRSLAEIGEQIRRTEAMSKFVVERFGEESDDRVARASMRILQSAMLELVTEERFDEEGKPVHLTAKEAKELSLALQRLVNAERTETERELKLRAAFKKEAAEKLDGAARTGEIDPDAVERAKRILGFA